MENYVCSGRTQDGEPCGWTSGPCPHHGADGKRRTARRKPPTNVIEPEPVSVAPPRQSLGLPGAVVQHDLRQLGWWLIGETLLENVDVRSASVVVTAMRVISALGPEPMAEEDALKEVELRGRIMNGQPPRNAEEWARAERVFDGDAIAEFRRWEARGKPRPELLRLEGDRDDRSQPLVFGDGAADE
jgi:hypothetical protein